MHRAVQVLRLDVGDAQGGAGLAPSNTSKAGFVLDNAVGNAHLAAEGRQVENQLNGVDIVGDDDELGLLLLDKSGDGVDALPDHGGALGGGVLLASGLGLSPGLEPVLL